MLRDFSKEKFDIIIQAGQSNSQGCGYGPVDYPFEPKSEILRMDSDFCIEKAREDVHGNDVAGDFCLSFADRYIGGKRLGDGRKILILAAAVGGTGFCDNRWGQNDDLFIRMMEMIKTALTLNPANRAVAFVWHQGETDTQVPVRNTHYDNLHSLVTKVRKAVGMGSLPFIAGDFVPQWKSENPEITEPIVAAIRDVCADIGSAAFVETEGLQSNNEKLGYDDSIHFCRNALYIMGNRYYEAFCQIVK